MFNNVALDVVIGLVFIYLLYSLLATIVQEFIAQILDLRARNLVRSIRVLLDDREEISGSMVTRWVRNLMQNLYNFIWCKLPDNKLSKAFFTNPTIKYLAPNSWKSKPSYISKADFTATLIRMLRGKDYDGTEPQMNAIYRALFNNDQVVTAGEAGKNLTTAPIDPETREHLKQLYLDAQKDIDRFENLLGHWFDETMERSSGWYKKQTQWILLVIGFVVAIGFNVDTIAITKILSKDEKARTSLVEMAIRSQGKYDTLAKQVQRVPVKDSIVIGKEDSATHVSDTIAVYRIKVTLLLPEGQMKEAYGTVKSDIDASRMTLGLGWPVKDSCKVCDSLSRQLVCCAGDSAKTAALKASIKDYNTRFYCAGNPYQEGGVSRLVGWLITALAISLGAPFWFDLLSKVIQLRSSVSKPKEGDANAAKDNSANIKKVG